jgi:O-antigen ligase
LFTKITLLEWLEWTLLGLGISTLILFEIYQANLAVIFGLLLAAFVLRALRTRRFLPRTGAELPLVVFMGSALLSTWAAYDRSLATLQLASLLATAVAFFAMAASSKSMRRLAAYGLVSFAVALGIYFILRHDFRWDIGKFAPITAVGLWLNGRLPEIPGPLIHPNVVGAVLSLAIPLAIALAVTAFTESRKALAVLTALLAVLATFALLLTSSRGAFLGLFGAFGLGLLVLIQRRWLPGPKARRVFWLGLTTFTLLIAVVLVQTGLFDRLAGGIPDPTGSMQSRLVFWEQGLLLARDYPFTGLGLLNFPMVFSTYTLLIHPFYISHTHNTYLQVLVEQGWPGFLALIGLGLATLRWAWVLIKRERPAPLAWSAMAALSAFAIHGMFECNLYLNRPLPLLGLVAGILAAGVDPARRRQQTGRKNTQETVGLLAIMAGCLVGILIVGLLIWRPLASAAYANLGAVAQTRLELTQYDPERFDDPTLDHIRQTTDLGRAQAYFNQALALAPNLTARQRLAGIALSQGDYENALDLLSAAWDNGARDEVTRLLFADALVASGLFLAVPYAVSDIPRAEGRLMFQAYYRYTLGGDYPRAIDAWEAVRTLNPDNNQALTEIASLQQKLPVP